MSKLPRLMHQTRIIIDRGEKYQNSKGKKNNQPNQGRDALEFIEDFQVIWVRLNSLSRCQKAKKGNLNPERVENGQGKMPKVSLQAEAEDQRELCGVGIWEKSGTSS